MKITKLETDWFRVPLRRPVSLPTSQDPKSASHIDVVTVVLHTDDAQFGFGYTYSFGGGSALRSLIESTISSIVQGLNAKRTEWIFGRVQAELEGVGFTGLLARAYAAVDLALWDLKAKLAHVPVHELLGGYRSSVKPISADVATPALGVKQSLRECQAALDRGSAGVQIEVGTNDPDLDYERLKQLRDDIPDGAWFEVNASGRYDFATATWLGTIGTEEFGLDGYCDPMKPDDANLRRLIDRLDVGVSVGAFCDRPSDFIQLLATGGVEALRLDPFRLGGLTPLRKVAYAAELNNVAIYPVRCPEIGVHFGCATLLGRMCEHVDWLESLFDGGPQLQNGQLIPSQQYGFGLQLNEAYAAKYRQ